MAMKRLIYMTMGVAALFLGGCNNDVDMLTSQKDAIVKYLTSSRRLIAQEEIGSVIEENPAFYTAFDQSVYRHITNYYAADRNEWAEVDEKSTIVINFNAYTFTGSEPNMQSIYWSNIPTTISSIEASNNHQYDKLIWEDKPMTIQLGRGHTIKGLETALIGCRDQDSVQVYMTSNVAYGKQLIGSVPKNSSVAWYIKILNVIK